MATTQSSGLTGHIPYLCKFAHSPFEGCYCRHVTGRTVPNIALYCMERYQECPIYRKETTVEASSDE